MKPTIGRIVHYTNLGDKDGKYPPEVQAALIVRVYNDTTVKLLVFYPTGIFYTESVMYTEAEPGTDAARGQWSWPKREE